MNSGSTYCSEVEYMLKAPTITPKTLCKNMPLRRSQRLSQKLKGGLQFSQNNVCDKKPLKPISLLQDIFSVQDSEMEKEIVCRKKTKQSFNEIKDTTAASGVPLDLSKKSELSTKETSRIRPCNKKKFSDAEKESMSLSNLKEQNILNFDKSKRPTKHVKEGPKVVVIPRRKSYTKRNSKKKSMNSLQTIIGCNHSENICLDVNTIRKRSYKRRKPLNENSSLWTGKRTKFTNVHNYTLRGSEILVKPTEKELPSKNDFKRKRIFLKPKCAKTRRIPCIKRNFNKDLVPITDYVKEMIQIDVSSDNTNFSKYNCKCRQSGKGNLALAFDSGNKNCNYSRRNSPKAITLTDELVKSENKLKLKRELKETGTEKNRGGCFNKTQIVTRSQKAISQSGQCVTLAKNVSNGFHQVEKIIKSESISSINNCDITFDTTTEKRLNENNSSEKSTMHKLQDISTEAKNAVSESNKILRSTKNITMNKKLLCGATAKVKKNVNKFGNECNKVKIELSQKSNEGKNQRKTLNTVSASSRNKTRFSPHSAFKQRRNSDELKSLNINVEAQLSSTNGITFFCESKKTDYSSQKINQVDKDIKPKTEFKSETTMLNKNYIQSFDRNQFLDKIQNAKDLVDKLPIKHNNYGQLKSFEIPTTPAESSEDFLKGSILPDIYPSHFKHQLPPHEALPLSVEFQSQPTYVITPDDTISSELLESSSTSPSLPESLCELFHKKNLKDILNIERASYRLFSYHIQALALILNLRLEYLCGILDKITNISPNVLKSIHKSVKMPFVPDSDIFGTIADELGGSNGIILNSQSPKQQQVSINANWIGQ